MRRVGFAGYSLRCYPATLLEPQRQLLGSSYLRQMAIFFLLPGSALGLPVPGLKPSLNCGSVSVCGIMTLETGKGTGTHLARSHHKHTQTQTLTHSVPR